jgi:hypothetical protein
MRIFEYIYYNLFIFYSKKEKGDRGPWIVICFIQMFLILILVLLPIRFIGGKEVIQQNFHLMKAVYLFTLVGIMFFNKIHFKGKIELLKERYKNESEKVRRKNTSIIFLSLLALAIIFFGSIIIQDGGLAQR